MNEYIAAMLAKFTDTIFKINKQEEKLTELSSKLSTYEYHIYKVSVNKIIQPLPLQVNNEQYKKITELSSKISTYEDHPEKMSITETQIQIMSLQIT